MCAYMARRQFNHIRLNQETKDRLDRLKAAGQSYDGLLRELLDMVERMLPMPPTEGPPLPRSWGIRWQAKERTNKQG